MNKSQRIKINPSNTDVDKHIKIKLEQNVRSLEFLSLKIDSTDIYGSFNADYGVLVGRVLANEGVGIENAKISIFIPLTENDENNSDVTKIYPYKTPRDKNNEDKRYNLLPRVSFLNDNGNITPKQPFGSFPTKPEIVTNETFLNVYKKYYKYTAVTNKSGDYMIFGVPVGTQTVHMSVDITDIGENSMNPAGMVINLGYSENLFIDNNTKIKPSSDLGDLPHIETQEISVDIIPFWGDVDNFEIGITRQDFRIKAVLINSFTVFGSVFTDELNSRWISGTHGNGVNMFSRLQLYRLNAIDNIYIENKRTANVTEKIYSYPNNISDVEIDANGIDLASKMILLDKTQYTIHKRGGDFIYVINCNRSKVITGDDGSPINVADDYNGGIYTKFRGFITLEITEDELSTPQKKYEKVIAPNSAGNYRRSVNTFRSRIKIPQTSPRNRDLSNPIFEHNWRNENFTFEGGKIYSISKFNGVVYNFSKNENNAAPTHNNGFIGGDTINNTDINNGRYCVGLIVIDNIENDDFVDNYGDIVPNSSTNIDTIGHRSSFGANWLNFSFYLPQLGYVGTNEFGISVNTFFGRYIGTNRTYVKDNEKLIAASETNNKWFLRSDLHWTTFVEVSENDIRIFNNDVDKKGFTDIDAPNINKTNYQNGFKDCPINGGGLNGKPVSATNDKDERYYFYKGFGESDCIQFVASILNIR